jgi:hypothetical protein
MLQLDPEAPDGDIDRRGTPDRHREPPLERCTLRKLLLRAGLSRRRRTPGTRAGTRRTCFGLRTPLALAAAGLVACGGDGTGPADVLPAELVGLWVAEPACLPNCGFTFASVAQPSDTLNVTAFVGLSTEITLTRDGTFRMRMRPGPDTASVARVHAGPGILIVTDAAGAVDTLDYTQAGNRLDVRFRRPFAVFDFTGDGVPDPAHARATLLRR